MYSPSFYRENRMDLITKLIRENSLATIITTDDRGEMMVTHIPLILKESTHPESSQTNVESPPELMLLGHMARANPHWKNLSALAVNSSSSESKTPQRLKIIFNGPNAYVTPSWYVENADNVPTWNYAVVHATGDFEILTQPAEALNDMQEVIANFESSYGTNWKLASKEEATKEIGASTNTSTHAHSDDVHEAVHEQLPYIVVFRFKNLKFEAKFKLGQKLDLVSRETVITELKALGEEKSESRLFDVAEYMELTRAE